MNTVHIVAWSLLVASAFGGFAILSQQGKAYGKNTWFYRNKVILGTLCILVIIACGLFLKFG